MSNYYGLIFIIAGGIFLALPAVVSSVFLNGRRNVTQLREEPWCKYRGFFIFQLKFHSINRHKYLQKKGGIN